MSVVMTSAISGVVGLTVGAVAAWALFGDSKNTVIRVFKDPAGTWHSVTANQRVALKRLMFMRWSIVEETPLPSGHYIELRFNGENSPFTEKRLKDDKRPNHRLIGALVPTGVDNAAYKYTVHLTDGITDTQLEDPVIVIEGKRG